jgi:hypothetical protein
MKIQNILLSIAMFIAMLSSCKKEDGSSNNNGNNALQLASVQFDFQGETQKQNFSFNSTGLINKITAEKWPAQEDSTKSQPFYTINVGWSSDTLSKVVITMAASQSSHTLDFIKDQKHQLVRKGLYPITISFGSETWLGFDNKGRVIADSNYGGGLFPVSNYKLFTWDTNDNIVKIESYMVNNAGSYTNNFTIESTYDQNKNPLYSYSPYFFALVVGEYYHFQSKNNLLQEKITSNGSTFVRNSYTYEYNQQGYPTKRILTSLPSSAPYAVKYDYK